ncbi:MAG: diguanylate cyclase domain-containing protein [Aquabacterium sp.]
MKRPPASTAQRMAQRAWRLLHVDAGEANKLVERAAARAERDGDAAGLAWALLVRGFHKSYFATPQDAEADLAQAAEHCARQGDRTGEILARTGHARALWRQGHAQAALALLLPLRDEGLALLRNAQRGVLLNAIAGCYSAQGQSETAFAYMYQALRDAGPKRGHGYDVALYCNLAHELIELGDHDEALRQVERGLERIASIHNGRLHTVLIVNRATCLTEIGRAGEALEDARRIADAQPDPSGDGLYAGHQESLAHAALRGGDLVLADRLIAAAQPQLPEGALNLLLARALRERLRGEPAAGLRLLELAKPLLDAQGDERVSARMRCRHAQVRAELHEAMGEADLALQALRDWQHHQADRAQRASNARYQAAALQTELLMLRQRLEEQDARRQAAERARGELADAHAKLMRKMAEVEALQSQLREQATQDALTGLANRRQLNDTLPALLALAQRESYPLGVVILDLDHFKRVNDSHGHLAGDQLLAAFGALLRSHLRKSDQAFRYGGEEFCLLLPCTAAADAKRKADALLADWRAQVFTLDDGSLLSQQSFSAGATDSKTSPGTPAELLRAADHLLLQAKRGQRGSVLTPGA